MNDARVFEATLQRCVERQRRAYIVAQLAFGLVVLGFVASVLQLAAAAIAYAVLPVLDWGWSLVPIALTLPPLTGEMLENASATTSAIGSVVYAAGWLAEKAATGFVEVVTALAPNAPADATTANGFVLVCAQLWSCLSWAVAAVVVHATKRLLGVSQPQHYVAAMNRVLRQTFGFSYDSLSDRLVRPVGDSRHL
jgi:hypothetical protein